MPKLAVPPAGIATGWSRSVAAESPAVTLKMLEANQDKQVPKNFRKEEVIKKINDAGGNVTGE